MTAAGIPSMVEGWAKLSSMITSRANAKIKQIRALKRRKERRELGLYLVEGIHHVGQAASAGVLDAILYCPELLTSAFAHQLVADQSAGGVPCHAATPDVFSTVAEKGNPQGIVGIARMRRVSLDALGPDGFDWGVAVVAPQDPGNVGTILRTIDAVGASGLILLDETVDPYHPTSVRASMGAIFWHPVVETGFAHFAAWAARHGYLVYGTSACAGEDYLQVDGYEKPCILLLGSERDGLPQDQTPVCHRLVRIPMSGKISSLNLSVAAGVMLYAMLERFGRLR
jgi:TrmH family RNA methyltransferase